MTACGEKAVIHYSVSPDKRGQGYGMKLLCLAAECMPSVKILARKVKPGNPASEKCFLKAGFEEKYREFELKLEGEKMKSYVTASGGVQSALPDRTDREAAA